MFRNSLPVVCLLLFGAAICVFADDQLDLQDLTEPLPGDLVDNIELSSLHNTQHENILVKNIFRDKCLRNSGSDEAFRKVTEAKENMKKCLSTLGSLNELKQEVEAARPLEELNAVFKKYCAKAPKLKECFFTFTPTIDPCLDEQERAIKVIMQNVADSLLDFICHREGERTALFFAEDGPECLESKEYEMKNCFDTIMGKYMPSGDITMDNLPRPSFDSEECQDLQSLQNCVVAELEKCETPTPANIIESLFKFINKQIPCTSKV